MCFARTFGYLEEIAASIRSAISRDWADVFRGVPPGVLGNRSRGGVVDAEARARRRNAYFVARQTYASAVLVGLWSAGKNQFIPHWVVIHKGEIVDLKSVQPDWADTGSLGWRSRFVTW